MVAVRIVLVENKYITELLQMASKILVYIADDLVIDKKRHELVLLIGAAVAECDSVEEAAEIRRVIWRVCDFENVVPSETARRYSPPAARSSCDGDGMVRWRAWRKFERSLWKKERTMREWGVVEREE